MNGTNQLKQIPSPCLWRLAGLAWRVVIGLIALCAASLGHGQEASVPAAIHPFRLGFSSRMFVDINEADAKVFLKVWTETIAKKVNIETDPRPVILDGVVSLEQALQSGQVDSATLTTLEYLAMSTNMQKGPVLLPVINGRSTEEYLLLVHRDGPIKELGDLQGRSLVWLDHPRACLARLWLDTLLAQEGLGPPDQLFGKVTPTKKMSQAVLPVFFRQADVCLTTRNGFQTAAELNPQVGRQLRVLATSSELVNQIFCYRPDYPASNRKETMAAATTMHMTPNGQQMQTVFKVERLEEQPLTCLDSARELLATHRRLCGATNGIKPSLARSAAQSGTAQ
jgi:ABC-type phosphate/phosphonate transport system substrate-binding protein